METKELIQIGKAAPILRKAQDLVSQAYALIIEDPKIKKHLKFDATVSWSDQTWEKLNAEWNKSNPNDDSSYNLRIFEYFDLPVGVCITTDGKTMANG